MNDHHDQIIQTHFFQSLINTLGCRLIGLMLRSDLRYDKKLLSRHTTGSDTFTDTALITVSLRCINMTVARSMERAKEIGIRRASGASRRQVISQFLFESLVTNSIAFILAIGLMEALMPSFNNQTGRDLSFSVWFTTSLGWYLLLIFAPGDGFVRHQADPDVERKVYPYAWGDGHPQGFGGVAIHGFSGVALRDVDRVCATSIYAECFFGGTGGPDAGS